MQLLARLSKGIYFEKRSEASVDKRRRVSERVLGPLGRNLYVAGKTVKTLPLIINMKSDSLDLMKMSLSWVLVLMVELKEPTTQTMDLRDTI